ncbi:peptidoglycan-binding protein [Reyranella sp. CPCC 100927]|uniref:peptidoglycan-binding protein n=1 Tax=Reyranella sp. CPCC 100927 TaxID=2599616 RepID=UPI0011B5E13E|nr:peptidoglycan-binding domain-containing protein [Reyranella sp. CPCC 100927]TWS98320.1 peptidoglycan-binding protein [Reyranella sp. CPCC 100927]
MKLKSIVFRGDKRLELAASNAPPMRLPERHPSVEKLKISLYGWGHLKRLFPLSPVYDAEFKEGVKSFQRSMGLKDDGVVGHFTMTRLDELEHLSEMPGVRDILPTPGVGPWGPYIGVSERATRRLEAKQMQSRVA